MFPGKEICPERSEVSRLLKFIKFYKNNRTSDAWQYFIFHKSDSEKK